MDVDPVQTSSPWEGDVRSLREEIQASEGRLRSEISRVEYELRGEMGKLECSLRADMTKMESGLRGDMVKMEAGIRGDMSRMESTLLKWSFLFWIGQVLAMSGVMSVLLRARP